MQAGRTFRVFVSSTFEDLKAERNASQDGVWRDGKLVKEGAFPRLRQLCEAHGARFQAIDLRWGVSQEASLDQQTMPLCLDEIARSQRVSPRPNFIVLLGDRYGWRPLPYEILADEFEHILSAVADPADRELLETWYRLDENAVPPVWALQPRSAPPSAGGTAEERGAALDAEETAWRETEDRLRGILAAAIDGLPLSDERRARYLASATEQEIAAGAFQVEDAPHHVFCFFRTIEGLPEDETADGFRDLDARGEPAAEPGRRLEELKLRLTEHVPDNLFQYQAAWTGGGIGDAHLEQLCDDVYHSLEAVILRELQALESAEPLAQEIAEHELFAEERTRHFRGRAAELEAIAHYLAATEPQPLAVWGESGTGKSALLAKAIEGARRAHPQSETVYRFIGVTPASSNGRELLEGLCRQVSRVYGADESDVPADYRELLGAFEGRLALATPDRPLILFLDALDQLREGDPARDLGWLPRALPANVRLVVSTLPGEILASLETRLPAENRIELGPMRVEEAEDVLDLWLGEAGRALQADQRRQLVRSFEACPRPLYLKLAFDEARRWRSYDAAQPLSPDVPGIIGDLFARLSDDANHGGVMVERSLGYLAAARNGLTEDELLDLLSADETVMRDFRRRAPRSPPVTRLPVVLWSRLFFDLEAYLTTRAADGTTLLAFYHPTSFGAAVAAEYLAGGTKPERHKSLARYFAGQSLRVEHDGRSVANLRKLSELPYQQARADLQDDLKSTLLDYPFIAAKVECFGPEPLVEDYDRAREVAADDESLRLVRGALRLSAHVLAADPTQTASQLTGRLLAAEPPEVRELLNEVGECQQQPWLRPITAGLTAAGGPLVRTLVSGAAEATALAVTPDGRYAASSGGPEVEVWDLAGGRRLHTLASRSEEVEAVALTPDGSRVIAGAGARFEIWDLGSGAPVLSFDVPVPEPRARANRVTGLAVSPDGRRLIIGHLTTVLVWDLERREAVTTLSIAKTFDYPASAVGISLDGSRGMSVGYGSRSSSKSSEDSGGPPRLWDLVRGRELLHPMFRPGILWGPVGSRAALSADATVAAVTDGRVLNIWDLRRWASEASGAEEGRGVTELVGREPCRAVAVTADGLRAITGSRMGSVELWQLDEGESLVLGRHDGAVECLAVSAEAGLAVSGSKDGTVKVWDLREVPRERKSGRSARFGFIRRGERKTQQTIERDAPIVAVAVSSRARRVVSTSAEEVGGPTTVAITPNGDRIVTVACGSLSLWDVDGGAIGSARAKFVVGEWEYYENPYRQIDQQEGLVGPLDNLIFQGSKVLKVWTGDRPEEPLALKGHERRINAVAIAPAGDKVVSASSDHTLKVWNLKNGKDLLTLTGHDGPVTAVAIAPDGRVVSGSADGTLRIWNPISGRSTATLQGHDGEVSTLLVTPEGRYAVSLSAGEAPTFKVWDLSHATEEVSLTTPADRISTVVLIGDGPSVVYASDDDLYLWDLQSGRTGTFASGHRGRITALASIPDKRSFVSSSEDGTLLLWDLDRATPVASYTCEASIKACAFSPDGSTVIAGDTLGILQFLRIERLASAGHA